MSSSYVHSSLSSVTGWTHLIMHWQTCIRTFAVAVHNTGANAPFSNNPQFHPESEMITYFDIHIFVFAAQLNKKRIWNINLTENAKLAQTVIFQLSFRVALLPQALDAFSVWKESWNHFGGKFIPSFRKQGLHLKSWVFQDLNTLHKAPRKGSRQNALFWSGQQWV